MFKTHERSGRYSKNVKVFQTSISIGRERTVSAYQAFYGYLSDNTLGKENLNYSCSYLNFVFWLLSGKSTFQKEIIKLNKIDIHIE